MSNKEKFEGFKQKIINENEKQYGKEIREKFGDAIVDASNAKMMGLTDEQYEKVQKDDPRFRKYYDDIAAGCAMFLHDAIKIYCE